ncbi:MAG: AAA family ATPase [Leptonema sp. (in: Bacteria)]|nr:AAA family ATPase [Leptonema sp. (in: bacteria)]
MSATDSPLAQWDLCKENLRSRIPEPFYNTFIEPLTALQIEQSVLSLVVPEARLKDHIEMRYGRILKETILKQFPGQISLVKFQGRDELPQLQDITSKPTKSTTKPITWDFKFLPHPALKNDLTELLQLRSFYRTIFITGKAGSGKTIFAQKWVNHFSGKATYLSLPDFLGGFVSSIRSHSTQDWKDELKSNSLLIIDDLQLLKPTAVRCQEELRHLIDSFEQENKLLVLLSDSDPESLQLSPSLKSRLLPSKQIHLIYPDKETRKQIIQSLIEIDRLSLKEEIIDHLADQIAVDMRLLKAAVHRISFQSKNPSKISITEVDRLCESLYHQEINVKPDTILSVVAQFYNVSVADIRSKAKDKKVSLARHTASYLCAQILNLTLNEVARITNRKDHTGVIYAINRIEKLLPQDLFFNRQIEEIKEEILNQSKR